MPTHPAPDLDVEMASTVYAVFLVLSDDFERRQGSPDSLRSPSLPVVGQWHLMVLRPNLTIIMNRFGLETILPTINRWGNVKIGREDKKRDWLRTV